MRNNKYLLLLVIVLTAVLLVLAACESSKTDDETDADTISNPVVRLVTTDTVNDSGLLAYLQPYFEEATGYTLEISAYSPAAAITAGENGEADCLLVYDQEAEEEFVTAGYGVERVPFMYSYYLIVGPAGDPAGVADSSSAASAFSKIASASGTDFVSRGDNSEVNKAEMNIWTEANINPADQSWYFTTASDMATTLNLAGERQAYCLTDKAAYLANATNLGLAILLEKTEDLQTTYALIAIDAQAWPDANSEGAAALIEWMTGDEAAGLIADYGVEDYGQQLFYVVDK